MKLEYGQNLIVAVDVVTYKILLFYMLFCVDTFAKTQVRKEAAISGSSYVPQISLLQRHAELLKGRFFIGTA